MTFMKLFCLELVASAPGSAIKEHRHFRRPFVLLRVFVTLWSFQTCYRFTQFPGLSKQKQATASVAPWVGPPLIATARPKRRPATLHRKLVALDCVTAAGSGG